jgi:hypothetical protein
VASEVYAPDVVREFLDSYLPRFQATLVTEFNQRLADKRPLRFQIADKGGVGRIVSGRRHKRLASEIRFQNSLSRTSAADFEKLAAVVLKAVGCREVYATPLSHDQGVDAFGYQELVRPTPYGVTHGLTWIAQAKHDRATKVSTCDVRELLGSKELLVSKVFSTVDERYKELQLRSFAPIAIALVTTEEIPSTVRRLADRAGVYVFAAGDLFFLLKRFLRGGTTVQAIRELVRRQSKTIRRLS